MRCFLIFVFILLVPFGGISQKIFATYDQYRTFLNTKTLIVLEDNPFLEYNFEIQEVIEREWTITEFEFIHNKDFENKRTNTGYSFLLLTEVTFEKDKSETRYNFLNLILGGRYKSLAEMPDLSAIPLSYLDVDEDAYLYKLGALVRLMQNHVKQVLEYPEILSSNLNDYYNSKVAGIEDKTLYLLKDEVTPELHSNTELAEIYPYEFKFVTTEEIRNAIENHDNDVVFLHLVSPLDRRSGSNCFKILIGAKNASYFYFDMHEVDEDKHPGLLPGDFRKIVKSKS